MIGSVLYYADSGSKMSEIKYFEEKHNFLRHSEELILSLEILQSGEILNENDPNFDVTVWNSQFQKSLLEKLLDLKEVLLRDSTASFSLL